MSKSVEEDRLAALGERVKARRLAMHMTIETAANRAGMSPVTWMRVEKGERVRDLTHVGVETSLQWYGNSIVDFLEDGTEPTVYGPAEPEPVSRATVGQRKTAEEAAAGYWQNTLPTTMRLGDDELEGLVSRLIEHLAPKATDPAGALFTTREIVRAMADPGQRERLGQVPFVDIVRVTSVNNLELRLQQLPIAHQIAISRLVDKLLTDPEADAGMDSANLPWAADAGRNRGAELQEAQDAEWDAQMVDEPAPEDPA